MYRATTLKIRIDKKYDTLVFIMLLTIILYQSNQNHGFAEAVTIVVTVVATVVATATLLSRSSEPSLGTDCFSLIGALPSGFLSYLG